MVRTTSDKKFKDFSRTKTSFQGPMFIQYIDFFDPFFTPKTLNSVITHFRFQIVQPWLMRLVSVTTFCNMTNHWLFYCTTSEVQKSILKCRYSNTILFNENDTTIFMFQQPFRASNFPFSLSSTSCSWRVLSLAAFLLKSIRLSVKSQLPSFLSFDTQIICWLQFQRSFCDAPL